MTSRQLGLINDIVIPTVFIIRLREAHIDSVGNETLST